MEKYVSFVRNHNHPDVKLFVSGFWRIPFVWAFVKYSSDIRQAIPLNTDQLPYVCKALTKRFPSVRIDCDENIEAFKDKNPFYVLRFSTAKGEVLYLKSLQGKSMQKGVELDKEIRHAYLSMSMRDIRSVYNLVLRHAGKYVVDILPVYLNIKNTLNDPNFLIVSRVFGRIRFMYLQDAEKYTFTEWQGNAQLFGYDEAMEKHERLSERHTDRCFSVIAAPKPKVNANKLQDYFCKKGNNNRVIVSIALKDYEWETNK